METEPKSPFNKEDFDNVLVDPAFYYSGHGPTYEADGNPMTDMFASLDHGEFQLPDWKLGKEWMLGVKC